MIKRILKRLAVILLVGTAAILPAMTQEAADDTPFNEAHFASTHNSYAGDIDGNRGSIIRQLDTGIRCLELDVHNDDFATQGYRIGHDKPGDRVFHHNGNAESSRLTDWLDTIANWSDQHPGHAPITLYLDIKDKLEGNYNDGNLAHLNDDLRTSFGSRLFEAHQLGERTWPSVRELRGKVVVLFTGELTNRLRYLRDPGSSPAVAINDSGFIVEVHDSGDGNLWYWTGRLLPDRSVEWFRHGRYAKGEHPTITTNSNGLFVEAHRSSDSRDGKLSYMLGRLDSDLEVRWTSTDSIPSSESFRAIDPAMARFNNDSDTLFVSTGKFGPFDDNTLIYRTNSGNWQPIRYVQVAFWEYSEGTPDDLLSLNPRFIAADAKDTRACRRAENLAFDNRLVRLWRFDDSSYTSDPPVNFPATDFPYATWYTGYCRRISCVE